MSRRAVIYAVILSVLIILAVLYALKTRADLEARSVKADDGWARVEGSVQERIDLIPNLLEAAKSISQEKPSLFANVSDARVSYANAKSTEARAEAAAHIELALSDLIAEIKKHPDIQNRANVTALINKLTELVATANESRVAFNESLRDYNDLAGKFPSVIIAKLFGFNKRPYLASL